jgi:hypothetical protein
LRKGRLALENNENRFGFVVLGQLMDALKSLEEKALKAMKSKSYLLESSDC